MKLGFLLTRFEEPACHPRMFEHRLSLIPIGLFWEGFVVYVFVFGHEQVIGHVSIFIITGLEHWRPVGLRKIATKVSPTLFINKPSVINRGVLTITNFQIKAG